MNLLSKFLLTLELFKDQKKLTTTNCILDLCILEYTIRRTRKIWRLLFNQQANGRTDIFDTLKSEELNLKNFIKIHPQLSCNYYKTPPAVYLTSQFHFHQSSCRRREKNGKENIALGILSYWNHGTISNFFKVGANMSPFTLVSDCYLFLPSPKNCKVVLGQLAWWSHAWLMFRQFSLKVCSWEYKNISLNLVFPQY